LIEISINTTFLFKIIFIYLVYLLNIKDIFAKYIGDIIIQLIQYTKKLIQGN